MNLLLKTLSMVISLIRPTDQSRYVINNRHRHTKWLDSSTLIIVLILPWTVLPQGAKVISNNISGTSSFSSTGKLVVQLADGTMKQYFMKVHSCSWTLFAWLITVWARRWCSSHVQRWIRMFPVQWLKLGIPSRDFQGRSRSLSYTYKPWSPFLL